MEADSDLKPWECTFCTFKNEPTWLVCGMCLKECEAPNGSGYQFDFPGISADDLIGLDAAPDYPVQPVVAMVSAVATTTASRVVCVPPIAVTVASTSSNSFIAVPAKQVAAPGYSSIGNTNKKNSCDATPFTGTAPFTPFSPVSSQNIASSIPNNATAKKYTPYTVAPVITTAAPVNGWVRDTSRRLVRVALPANFKAVTAPVYPGAARVRVITPQSNPSYFNLNSANIVTSTTTSVPTALSFNFPSYNGGTRLPLPSRTETPLTFPTYSANAPIPTVTSLIGTSAPNTFNSGAQFAQSNLPVTLPRYNGPFSPVVSAQSISSANVDNTLYNTGAQRRDSTASTFPAAPVVSSLPNVFQRHPASQQLPAVCAQTSRSFPNTVNNTVTVTSTLPHVPNTPPVINAHTVNGAARVTTAAFADAFATDSTPGWMCSFCTFINDNLLLRCAVCDTEKPIKIPNEQPVVALPPPVDFNPDFANHTHFECPSCYLLFVQSKGIVLQNCGHKFCRTCLREVISYSEEVQLKCPYKIRGVFCNSLLTDQEIGLILNLQFTAINNSNVITARSVQQNAIPGLSAQNSLPGPSQQNDVPVPSQQDAVPGPSCLNIAAGDFIDLCSDNEDEDRTTTNLPIAAERNAREVGNEINYQELLDLEKEVLITNLESFECTICMTEQEPGEGVVMRECLHMFCRECLKQAIKCNTDAEMKCPYGDGTTRCESMLQDREIKALVDANDFEKHLSRSIKEAEGKIQNTFHCKTVDCIGWCEYDEDVINFNCPVCSKTNCINCKAIHTGLDCKQYQIHVQLNSANNPEDAKTNKMLQSMLTKGTAMNCPKCGIILSKVTGCDWLCCSMCKTEICWVTRGHRWGPKGRGDYSGGCGCRLTSGGKRCHPRCGNCH